AAWVASGTAFPVLLHVLAGPLPPWVFLHFIASQTLCGLIAVAYPFFGLTYLGVRALYPGLLTAGPADLSEGEELVRAGRAGGPCPGPRPCGWWWAGAARGRWGCSARGGRWAGAGCPPWPAASRPT